MKELISFSTPHTQLEALMRIIAKAILAIILFFGINSSTDAAEPARQAVMATPPPGFGQDAGIITDENWERYRTTPDVPGTRLLYLGTAAPEACASSPFCMPIANHKCGRWAEVTLNGLAVTVLTPSEKAEDNYLPLIADTNNKAEVFRPKSLVPPASCTRRSDGSYQFVNATRGWLVLDVFQAGTAVNIDVTPYVGAEPVGEDNAPEPSTVLVNGNDVDALFSWAVLAPVACHVTQDFSGLSNIQLPTCP